jgi:glycosyl transferase family 25
MRPPTVFQDYLTMEQSRMVQSQVPILIINMDRSTDRLQQISNRLEKLELSFERVPAISGSTLTNFEKNRVNPKRSWLQLYDDDIGCYLSHLKAIRIVADRELQRAIILEDDAAFDDDFPVWARFDCPLPDDADILKLEGFGAMDTLKIPVLNCNNRVIQFSYKSTGGAAAYLITLEGARKALKALDVMRGEIDYDLTAYWRTGLVVYDVSPFPARQSVATTKYREVPKRTLVYSVGRRTLKLSDKIGRFNFAIRKFGIRTLLTRPRLPGHAVKF